jgi:DNA-binding NarL/FixJ family response regulator
MAKPRRGRPPRDTPITPELADLLRDLSRRLEHAAVSRTDLEQQRDRTILRALKAGWTHAQISQAAGLSRGRIAQIAARERAKDH